MSQLEVRVLESKESADVVLVRFSEPIVAFRIVAPEAKKVAEAMITVMDHVLVPEEVGNGDSHAGEGRYEAGAGSSDDEGH